jgi:nitroreductase
MQEMSVSEAIRTRKSCRAFLNKPVPREVIDRIIEQGTEYPIYPPKLHEPYR